MPSQKYQDSRKNLKLKVWSRIFQFFLKKLPSRGSTAPSHLIQYALSQKELVQDVENTYVFSKKEIANK